MLMRVLQHLLIFKVMAFLKKKISFVWIFVVVGSFAFFKLLKGLNSELESCFFWCQWLVYLTYMRTYGIAKETAGFTLKCFHCL